VRVLTRTVFCFALHTTRGAVCFRPRGGLRAYRSTLRLDGLWCIWTNARTSAVRSSCMGYRAHSLDADNMLPAPGTGYRRDVLAPLHTRIFAYNAYLWRSYRQQAPSRVKRWRSTSARFASKLRLPAARMCLSNDAHALQHLPTYLPRAPPPPLLPHPCGASGSTPPSPLLLLSPSVAARKP